MPGVQKSRARAILEDLHRVLDPGNPRPSYRLYRQRGGQWSESSIYSNFGSWPEAVQLWRNGLAFDPEGMAVGTVQVGKDRRCLRCDKRFLSSWNGHRLCQECREHLAHTSHEQTYRLPLRSEVSVGD